MQLTPGTLLERGKYRIIETLGRGGFGVTYHAEQVMAKRKVCIKEFFPMDYYKRDGDAGALTISSDGFAESMNRFKAKFIKEAQTIATLNHANIIPIYDIFEENGTAYYVMEFVEGVSLSDIVKRSGAMSERDAVAYIKQVASALEHIHARQIMHLDVKPGNIMVREEDRRAILIDFGLSKHYDATSGEATPTTPVGVSHGFAPMEQYRPGGVSTFSPETDIYSLGATLYYLVTGCVPPLAVDIADDGLPALPTHLSYGVRTAIERSMTEKRKDRPHTIKDFLALLDSDEPVVAVLADESEKTKIAPHKPTPKRESNEDKPKQKRSRWWLWFLILLLISGGAWFIFGDNKEEKNTESEALPEENVESEAFPETSAPYKVGDLYNEDGKQGVVFEIWDNGRHGKIVSLNETKLQWCTDEQYKREIVLGLTNKSDGKTNTDNVMQRSDSDQYPAFVWCRHKGADWYLPAYDELKAIYNNQSAINSTLAEYNCTTFCTTVSGFYCSSTEDNDEPEFCAWYVGMDDGDTYYYDKYSNYYVRAVSAF